MYWYQFSEEGDQLVPMEMMPISNKHLVIAQRIISFVQEQGWDVSAISIERYDDFDRPILGRTEGEEWKGEKLKWHLRLSVAPRDDKEMAPKVEKLDLQR